jgi:hypothetical protein
MAPQELEQQQAQSQESVGPLAAIPTLQAVPRRRRTGGNSWHKTVTKHVPEPWPAALMALQARIAALDIE